LFAPTVLLEGPMSGQVACFAERLAVAACCCRLVDVQDWTHPPFGGVVADGFVWGRGAMDVKVSHSFAAETSDVSSVGRSNTCSHWRNKNAVGALFEKAVSVICKAAADASTAWHQRLASRMLVCNTCSMRGGARPGLRPVGLSLYSRSLQACSGGGLACSALHGVSRTESMEPCCRIAHCTHKAPPCCGPACAVCAVAYRC
jgi:hypothetical protein